MHPVFAACVQEARDWGYRHWRALRPHYRMVGLRAHGLPRDADEQRGGPIHCPTLDGLCCPLGAVNLGHWLRPTSVIRVTGVNELFPVLASHLNWPADQGALADFIEGWQWGQYDTDEALATALGVAQEAHEPAYRA